MNLIRAPKISQPNISSQSVRYLNELRALDVLFREGGMSRADLARALGLTRSTTGSIITNLLADSLVVEQGNLARDLSAIRTGRPGIDIAINPAGATFIGAAIEADRITALAIDLAGSIVRIATEPFQAARHTPDIAAEVVAKLINALIASTSDRTRILGVCVAVPAMFEGEVILQATLLGWRDVDLRPLIAERLSADLPITVENDANVCAIAETYCSASAPTSIVALVLIDSGAGGGIVVHGRLLRGGFGIAGEFGHIRIGEHGYAEQRGEPGTLETYVGREALLARYGEQGGARDANLLEFLSALEKGEGAAVRTAAEWGDWLSKGLLTIINVINPSVIVIGGPVGSVFRFVAGHVEARLRTMLPPGFPQAKLELSRFGPEGPAYGSALMLHQRAFSIDERALYPNGANRRLFATSSA